MADTISYDEIRRSVRGYPRILSLLVAFDFAHLPPELQAISKPFCDLAHTHAATLAGRTDARPMHYRVVHMEHGLERLLEAKDAIVRSALAV